MTKRVRQKKNSPWKCSHRYCEQTTQWMFGRKNITTNVRKMRISEISHLSVEQDTLVTFKRKWRLEGFRLERSNQNYRIWNEIKQLRVFLVDRNDRSTKSPIAEEDMFHQRIRLTKTLPIDDILIRRVLYELDYEFLWNKSTNSLLTRSISERESFFYFSLFLHCFYATVLGKWRFLN